MILRVHHVTHGAGEPQEFQGSEGAIVRFGRGVGNDVRFDEGAGLVSSIHAEAQFSKGRWILRDTNSRNGIFVDGNLCQLMVLTCRHQVMFGASGLCLWLEVIAPPSAVLGGRTTRQQEVSQQDAYSVNPTRDGTSPWVQRMSHAPSSNPPRSDMSARRMSSPGPLSMPWLTQAPGAHAETRTVLNEGVKPPNDGELGDSSGQKARSLAVLVVFGAIVIAALALADRLPTEDLLALLTSGPSTSRPEPQPPVEAPRSVSACPNPMVILVGDSRDSPDKHPWDVTRQTLLALPEFTVVRAVPAASGEVHLAAYRSGGGGLTLIADCAAAATCQSFAARYQAIVRSSHPQFLCTSPPGMSTPAIEFGWSLEASDNLTTIGNDRALCAHINACTLTSKSTTPGDPLLECLREKTKSKTSCASLPSCPEVTSCLNGDR